MLVDGKEINIGSMVKFTTINNYDTNVWQGVVEGFVKYPIAKVYTDVITYHQNVLRSNRELFLIGPDDYRQANDLDYLLLKALDGTVRAFAIEWVTPTTLEIVDPSVDSKQLKFYNLTESALTNLENVLRDHGYTFRVL